MYIEFSCTFIYMLDMTFFYICCMFDVLRCMCIFMFSKIFEEEYNTHLKSIFNIWNSNRISIEIWNIGLGDFRKGKRTKI